MGFMYEFPHTANFDSDLRQILEMYVTVKDLPTEWTAFRETLLGDWNSLRDFVTNYFNNLDVQNEVNSKLESMLADGSLETILKSLFNDYQENIDVLSARMDTFTRLAEGSTTGDAELADLRVDYTGKAWNNAGDAVRGVTAKLSNQIDIVSDCFETNILRPQLIENEELLADGSVISRDGYSRTDYIELCGSKTLHFYDIYTNVYRYVLFDALKAVISSGLLSQGDMTLDIPGNAQYIAYSCPTTVMEEIKISLPLAEAVKEKVTAKKTIIIDKNAEEVEGEIYNSFYKGMNYAYQNYYDVVVKTGVYDMYQECIDANGANYWESLASAVQSNNGAHIGHDMHVNISPSATIKCHVPYEQFTPYFSPIYVGQGSYTLDGGNFDCKYTRYIVHDDNYSGKEETHIIRNTHMYLDTHSQGDKGYASCIGAGQNGRTKYIVENNYFEGYLQNIQGAPSMLIGWHGLSNVQEFDIISSLFVIKDNFLNGWGTIYLSSSSNDNADEQSFAYVSNNRLGANMIIDNTNNNLTVYDWNNQIANPNN